MLKKEFGGAYVDLVRENKALSVESIPLEPLEADRWFRFVADEATADALRRLMLDEAQTAEIDRLCSSGPRP